MPKIVDVSDDDDRETLRDGMFRAIQSSHLTFLLGAGASYPGLPIPGTIEADIESLLEKQNIKEANRKALLFLGQFQGPMHALIDDTISGPVKSSLDQYVDFIRVLDTILSERKTTLFPKQASIFTTNYDLFVEKASELCPAILLNDGFGRRRDIEKLFDTSGKSEFWKSNFAVVNLDHVNIDMKKMIPLLLAKRLYQEHKETGKGKALTIIIDEAHNILSTESFRETEGWKDYRLETFEEIIKEGRKFGVFVTISSQRPNDISPTIASQAHNYFIHRLANQKDLATISSAVSYIDKMSETSIPTLPVGTCIFSGVAGQMPLKVRVKPLLDKKRPTSHTLAFDGIVRPTSRSV